MEHLRYRQVHLDFHTPALPYQLGGKFEKDTFQKRLKDGHINSITLTARCHHGHIYYDTKFPARHPQMKGDFLMELVDACHEINVNCPLYLTAGWDAYSADHHPEWLERHADGSLFGFENFGQLEPGWKTLCFNTGYREYLFAQTEETMTHFRGKLDGLFFDIVRQDPCLCNDCIKLMLEQGFDPENQSSREAFALKTKIAFKKEMTAFIAAIDPNCSVFYNEGNITPAIRTNLEDYSHFEIESLASGDWGYQHFPVVVRYAKNLGKEYMGMTGKFQRNWADFGSYKNQAALEYECFLAAAHGAKCSIGDQMYGDGTIQEATYQLIGNVYQQVEAIELWLEGAKAVTEIAIVHPNLYQKSKEKVDISLAGAVNMLNEAHLQFDIIDDQMAFDGYRVVILPDHLEVEAKLEQKLSAYVKNGGKLLALYHGGLLRGAARFIQPLKVEYVSEAAFEPMYAVLKAEDNAFLAKGEQVLHGKGAYVKATDKTIGALWEPLYNRSYQHYYSHYQAPISQDSGHPLMVETAQGIYISHELFTMYKVYGAREYKELVLLALNRLLKGRFIETDAPATSDVILNYQSKEQRLVLNYLNYIPQKQSLRVETIEASTPVHETEFSLNLGLIFEKLQKDHKTVKCVRAIRSDQMLSFKVDHDRLRFNLPLLADYELIEVVFHEEKYNA